MATIGFWISASVAILGLGVAYRTGRRGRRRQHLTVAIGALVALAVAIVFAEQMGREREFPAQLMRVHLVFAKAAAFATLPVIVTGILLLRRPRWRRWHRWAVWGFLALAVTATWTGVWAFTHSTPR